MKRLFILCLVLLLDQHVYSQAGVPQDRRKSPTELQQAAARYASFYARRKSEAEAKAAMKGWLVREEFPDGRIIEIMEIGPNGMPEYNTTNNLNAAKTTGTNKLWPGGTSGLNLTGAGFTIGEWDGGGVRTNHQEFRVGTGSSRVTQKDGASPTSYHSTHVAGTLIAEGDAGSAQGMANAANLHAYDWDNDVSEMLNANAVDGIILSNHSYGRVRGWNYNGWDYYWTGDTTISRTEDYQFGFYGPLTKTWDSMAYAMQDYLFVKAAGNDRGETHTGIHYVWDETLDDWVRSSWPRDIDGGADGYDCIENRACAKNLLTVGAVDDIPGGYTSPADVIMSSFSGWGPTDDGRIKPDIVANGIDVYSTDDDADNDYTTLSGTSMSTPNVCGTLALLQDYHYDLMGTYMYADEMKALVINTAYEAGPDPGPDYMFGWGLLNAKGAADLITLEDAEGHHINYYTLLHASEVDEYLYYADGSEDINVTIAWIDPPHAALSPSLNPTTLHKVHDLDVRVVRVSNGTYYYPWKLNPASPASAAYTGDNTRDNIEKVTISSPAAGQYKILVSLSGSLTEDQFYALVVSGMEHVGVPGRWTGAVSNNWNTAGNWDDGLVPDITVSVTIPSGCPRYPVLTGSLGVSYSTGMSYVCDNLNVNTGGILTIQTYSLYSSGNMDLDGTVYVGNDVYLYNGSILDMGGSLYTGYTDGYFGDFIVSSGATINQTGGNLYTEMINLASGCQYNGSGGYCRIYAQGSIPTTQNIQVDDADSYFNNLYVESGTNALMYDCAADLDAWNMDINGIFTLNGFTVNTDYADVYGTLTITGGVYGVAINGPFFQEGAVLNMSGGELNANQSIKFLIGATENVTGGDITLLGDFYDEDEIFSPSGGSFHFEGSGASNINGPTSFFTLYINKTYAGFDAVENGTGDGLGVDISVLDFLDITDGTLELNSPCTLSVARYIFIDTDAVLNANDEPDIHIQVGGSWENMNLTGGFSAGSHSIVEFNAPPGSTGIQIVRENNLFNDIIINSGAPYVRPSINVGYGLIHARNIDITDGMLSCGGEKVIVDETLNIFDMMTMIDPLDSLIVGDILWKAGSSDVISNGKIIVTGSWTWENGTNATITSGNLVRFTGSSTDYIYSYDADADFYDVDIEKGANVLYIASASTQPVDILHNLNIFSPSYFILNAETLNVNGTLDVKETAHITLYSGSTVDLDGDFTQKGFVHLNTGGTFYVHGNYQEAATGHLNLQNGSFICDRPYNAASPIQSMYGTLVIDDGTLEISHNHLRLESSFIDDITGGFIRVGGSFIAISNVFQPSGNNTVELINFSSTGNPYIDLNSGNWLINLAISGNVNWYIGGTGAATLTIKQDLTINSGALEGTAGDLIYLGDDWINNAGNTGFIPGTSIVYLTAENPAPDRQMISGTTTFYDLGNQNNTTLIEFAGPVTVSHNYYGSAGGTEGETFVTGSPVNITNLILPSGVLSLSTSAPTVNITSFDQGGAVTVTDGYLDINDIPESYLEGTYTIYDGTININQDADYFDINGDLYIHGGQMILSGGIDASYWPVDGTHILEMSGGILQYETLGIRLYNNNMTYNITGGAIRTVGDFISNTAVSVFDPSGGTVELYGSAAANVNLGTGSWFHNLTVSKTGSTVNATNAFPVKGALDVQGGTFNTNNYLITVGP